MPPPAILEIRLSAGGAVVRFRVQLGLCAWAVMIAGVCNVTYSSLTHFAADWARVSDRGPANGYA